MAMPRVGVLHARLENHSTVSGPRTTWKSRSELASLSWQADCLSRTFVSDGYTRMACRQTLPSSSGSYFLEEPCEPPEPEDPLEGLAPAPGFFGGGESSVTFLGPGSYPPLFSTPLF